jgi:hypothetical protein
MLTSVNILILEILHVPGIRDLWTMVISHSTVHVFKPNQYIIFVNNKYVTVIK